jgi:PAS domain S-box-containing protein
MKTEHLSPSWIFTSVLVLIFCAEEALTYALDHFLPAAISQHTKAALDAGTLTLIMSLFIWWLVMRPLRLALMNESAMAKAVTDAAADAIITTDERGTIESCNPAALTMFGYIANELIGNNVAMLIHESHADEYLRQIQDHLRSDGARAGGLSSEFWARRKDRSEFPVELTMAQTRLGGVARYTSIIRDITEHKRMEEALRASAAELRIIIDTVPAMIVYYDAGLRCRFANKRYADFFGLDATEIAGKHLREVVGDAAFAVAEAEFNKALTGHSQLTYERTQPHGNGESVPLEIKLVPHFGKNGKPLGVYGLLEDITAHKATEERIRRLTNYDSVTGLADRASMQSALELRAPFLDRHVMEFAAGLPVRERVAGFETKAFLKRYAMRYLPKKIVYRRKRGLSVPLAIWLRGPLEGWAREMLSSGRLDHVGLSTKAALEIFEEHQMRRADHARALWTLLALSEWIAWAERRGTRWDSPTGRGS